MSDNEAFIACSDTDVGKGANLKVVNFSYGSGAVDCGKEISDAASTCIHCGRRQGSTATVTTASKRFKSQQLRGGIAIGIVGSGIRAAVAGLGSLIFLSGLFVWIGGRFGAW
jgi:hypothetical protein